MSDPVAIKAPLPLDDETLGRLKAGMRVLITGELICARDAAHARMIKALDSGKPLPFDPRGAVIYYVGPTPGDENRPVGSAGPTTSARMDGLLEPLLEAGVRATVGKGPRTKAAKDALKRHGAVYFAATGGAGALLGSKVEKAEILAYDDLGAEALRRFVVRDFPAIVAIDTEGRDLFETGPAAYAAEK